MHSTVGNAQLESGLSLDERTWGAAVAKKAALEHSGADSVVTGVVGQDLMLMLKAASESGLKAGLYTYYGNTRGLATALGKAAIVAEPRTSPSPRQNSSGRQCGRISRRGRRNAFAAQSGFSEPQIRWTIVSKQVSAACLCSFWPLLALVIKGTPSLTGSRGVF